MAKKMIPVKAIDPLTKADTFTIKIDKLGDYEVIIKDTLDMGDMLGFVDEVSSNVIDLEDDMFYPELKNFFIDMEVLIRYANFKLPSDISKQYDFIANNQDIVKTVVQYINTDQYYWILEAIDERIDHIKTVRATMLSSQFNDLATQISEYTEQITNMFNGITNEELSAAIRTFGDSAAIDEGKIVKAVFDSQKE